MRAGTVIAVTTTTAQKRPLEDPHPTYVDPIQGLTYRIHCTAAGCGTYIDDQPASQGAPGVDVLCDDCS